jgi:hypothetical protein
LANLSINPIQNLMIIRKLAQTVSTPMSFHTPKQNTAKPETEYRVARPRALIANDPPDSREACPISVG